MAISVATALTCNASGGVVSATANMVVLEDFSNPNHEWIEMNDPVMGGKSTGTFGVEDGLGKFVGTVAIVPFLHAPGFIKVETKSATDWPDISSCVGIQLTAKANTDYKGYRFSFGHAKPPNAFPYIYGYKSNFALAQSSEENFVDIQLPFDNFTDNWDPATGDAVVPCDRNNHPEFCPDEATKQNLYSIAIWGEGIEGDVSLDIKMISAYGCDDDEVVGSTTISRINQDVDEKKSIKKSSPKQNDDEDGYVSVKSMKKSSKKSKGDGVGSSKDAKKSSKKSKEDDGVPIDDIKLSSIKNDDDSKDSVDATKSSKSKSKKSSKKNSSKSSKKNDDDGSSSSKSAKKKTSKKDKSSKMGKDGSKSTKKKSSKGDKSSKKSKDGSKSTKNKSSKSDKSSKKSKKSSKKEKSSSSTSTTPSSSSPFKDDSLLPDIKLMDGDDDGTDAVEILIEDFANPINSWTTLNDPVMGGKSTSSLTIDDGVASFRGTCAVVPSLNAPGFITMVTGHPYSQGPATFPDVSSCKALKVNLRTMVDGYKGYYLSFGTDRVPGGHHAMGYKTYLDDTIPIGEFADIVLPFNAFSSKWDDASGKIEVSCSDDIQYCPTLETLQNMKSMSFWGEGMEGEIALDIKSIRAIGCGSADNTSIGIPATASSADSIPSFVLSPQEASVASMTTAISHDASRTFSFSAAPAGLLFIGVTVFVAFGLLVAKRTIQHNSKRAEYQELSLGDDF